MPADLLLGFLALLASAASSASAIFFASSFFAAASARCLSCTHFQSTQNLLSPVRGCILKFVLVALSTGKSLPVQ